MHKRVIGVVKSLFSGEQLKAWREDKGWKRSYLAQQLGVSQTSIWGWEKQEYVPIWLALACRSVDNNLKPMGE